MSLSEYQRRLLQLRDRPIRRTDTGPESPLPDPTPFYNRITGTGSTSSDEPVAFSESLVAIQSISLISEGGTALIRFFVKFAAVEKWFGITIRGETNYFQFDPPLFNLPNEDVTLQVTVVSGTPTTWQAVFYGSIIHLG